MTVLLLAYYYYYADQLNSTQVCLKTVAEWLKQTELSERTIKANRINEVNRYSLLIIIYVKKTTVLNTLVTMTLTSDVENSKN